MDVSCDQMGSPSQVSRRSHDSGFSDADVRTVCRREDRLSSSSSGSDKKVSLEDLSNIPPPQCSSTPKSKAAAAEESIDLSRRECSNPVDLWLQEVRYWCDPECMTTLQNKPITAGTSEKVTKTTAIAVDAINKLNSQLIVVYDRVGMFYRRLKAGKLSHSSNIFERLIRRMAKILSEFDENRCGEFDCSHLRSAFKELSYRENENSKLISILKKVALQFSQKIDQVLLKYIKMLIDLLQEEPTPSSMSIVLSGIKCLELRVPHLSELLTICSGITSLLFAIVDSSSPAIRTTTLGILATMCCTSGSIKQFELTGGLEILCDIISSKKRREAEKCAAVSLLAQISGPWLDVTAQGIYRHLETLIPSITLLIHSNPSTEMLMMCSTALANISGIELTCVSQLVHCNSVGVLINTVRVLGTKASVFIKEQTATLLANLSAVKGVLPYLRKSRAIPALLCFLETSVSPLDGQSERSANTRLQYKASIALSRLCSDPEASKQVVELQGLPRIVKLCKDEKERNFNDGVLVASLVTLRRISTHCGTHVLKSLNASELVEQSLLESFLLFSSVSEE